MIRASVYRLHPGTLRRAQGLARIAGANRYVWNWAIGQNEDAMKAYLEGRGERPNFSFFRWAWLSRNCAAAKVMNGWGSCRLPRFAMC